MVRLHLSERLLGPLDDQPIGVRDPLTRSELGACVHDDRLPAEQLRRLAECVGRVDRTDDHEPRRRAVDLGEDTGVVELEEAVPRCPDQLVRLSERGRRDAVADHLAALER